MALDRFEAVAVISVLVLFLAVGCAPSPRTETAPASSVSPYAQAWAPRSWSPDFSHPPTAASPHSASAQPTALPGPKRGGDEELLVRYGGAWKAMVAKRNGVGVADLDKGVSITRLRIDETAAGARFCVTYAASLDWAKAEGEDSFVVRVDSADPLAVRIPDLVGRWLSAAEVASFAERAPEAARLATVAFGKHLKFDSAPSVDAAPATCAGPEGLYTDSACLVLAAGLRAYSPRYPLWADGAEKERYVRLPEGAVIDTADPDNWIFPVGTIFYKTFLREGRRLETRVLRKTTPETGFGAWEIKTYGWQADQRAAIDMTTDDSCPDCATRRQNVLGTTHVIPDGTQCRECHRAALDIVNGFSAIQLNHSATPLSLKDLIDERRLSQPRNMVAEAVVPGDRTTEQALGYLHANCGHCHRSASKADRECKTPACLTGLLTSVQVGTARVDDTDLYRSAIGRRSIYRQLVPDVSCRIAAGHPDESVVFLRMNTRDPNGHRPMPKLGTKEVDPFGVAAVRAFIEGLPSGTSDCSTL